MICLLKKIFYNATQDVKLYWNFTQDFHSDSNLNSNLKDGKLRDKNKKSLQVPESSSVDDPNNFNSQLKSNLVKKSIEKRSKPSIENDEEELEFLLSLKEPIHTGPVYIVKKLENGWWKLQIGFFISILLEIFWLY